ncbi:MAG: leucine-rich repeat domain-containing protein, partial [Lachnospiraceae bacterium]|nr:leucine-rich repeat domain-containing protein [Lachnospiraceae bacterium]
MFRRYGMKKRISKSIAAVVICLGMVCNGPALSAMAEEADLSGMNTVEEAEPSELSGADETDIPGMSTLEETDAEPAESDPAGDELLSSYDVDDAEEPALEDMDPEEQLGDVEYKYYKPYESATYELKYHVLDDETISIDGYKDTAYGALVIPDKIDGKAVTVIGDSAFYNCNCFTGSLTIPDSVTTIGQKAFDYCNGFSGSLTIPDSVTTIGQKAFECCNGFSGSLMIGGSVTTIGEKAFEGCRGFTGSLTIPDSVTTIGESAFKECRGFSGSLTIPDSVTTLGYNAFYGCSGLAGSLTIGKNVRDASKIDGRNGFRKVVNRSNQAYPLLGSVGKTWIDAKTGAPITYIANGTAIRSDFYDPVDAPLFTHTAVEDQTYTGKAIKPAVEVYFGTRHLEEKKDYTITYANNINAGMASFTVIGKGNYAEKDSDSFVILKKKLTDADVTVTEPAASKYTKKEQKPVPKITYNGMTLKKGKDYEIAYFADEGLREWCIPKDPGTYYIRITGIGNFEAQLKMPFVIANPTKKLMSSLKADKIKAQDYTTGGVTLSDEDLVIRDGGKTLKKGEDYVVDDDIDYTDNKSPGTAKVTLHGVEEKGYVGTLTLSFQITGIPISKAVITTPHDCEYDGTEQQPELWITYNGKKLNTWEYKLVYEKNKNIGKAKVTIYGRGKYTGSVSRTFTIKPANLKETATITLIPFEAESGDEYPYVQSGVKPAVKVVFKESVLEEGKDYTVKYTNNTAITTDATTKRPTVTVTGKGNFTGKADQTFVITGANI